MFRIRKARAFPFPCDVLEQFAVPVWRVRVLLTALLLETVAFEMS